MLQPFTSKSFAIRPLADVIADLKYLSYLYPNIPKEQAFGKYYTPLGEQHASPNGYVKPQLITHVPGWVKEFNFVLCNLGILLNDFDIFIVSRYQKYCTK